MENLTFALLVTLFAGLSTGIGSAIAFFAKRTNYRFLSVSTGFSAGVMLYVSFVEILPKGGEFLEAVYSNNLGHWINVLSFFGGILVIALIDNLIPSAANPHEIPTEAETAPLHDPSAPLPPTAPPELVAAVKGTDPQQSPQHHAQMMRMGLFTALAIAIHNLPEGLATFLAALKEPQLGLAIGIAIAIHNIPEGIAVSVPIFYATGNRRKAFIYSFLSGMAEFLGAIIGFLLLWLAVGDEGGLPDQVMGIVFGGIAGIMVYISLDELLPTSRAYGKKHDSLIGLLVGMAVMAVSLLLLE